MDLIPEVRYRGLHEVPVYTANSVMSGEFAQPDMLGLGIDHVTLDLSSWGSSGDSGPSQEELFAGSRT